MSAEQVELGELMVRRGGSINPAKHPDEVFELYSIPAHDAGRPDVVSGSEIGSAKQIVEPGDVMISKIVPHIRRSTVVGRSAGKRQIASGEWIVFRDQRTDPNYLRQLLVSDWFHSKFMATVSGVGGSLLRARPAEVAKIKIPLPPLPEQRRIAAILDKADALRAKRREAIARLDELLQSVFLDMFGDPVTNPKGWPIRKSGDLFCVPPRIGTTRPASGTGNLVVRVGEIGERGIRLDKSSRVELAPNDVEKYSLQPGDTVIARAIGSKEQLGKASYFEGSSEIVVFDSHVMRLRPNPSMIDPQWFNYLVSSPSGKRMIQAKGGATAVQFNINAKQISDLDVPVPPKSHQGTFSELLRSCSRSASQMNIEKQRLDDLFSSIQQQAFS